MIEHHEAILECYSQLLHPSHEVDATPGAMHEHFEDLYLFLAMAREYTVTMLQFLHAASSLEFDQSRLCLCPERGRCGDHVPNVRRIEHAKLFHHGRLLILCPHSISFWTRPTVDKKRLQEFSAVAAEQQWPSSWRR